MSEAVTAAVGEMQDDPALARLRGTNPELAELLERLGRKIRERNAARSAEVAKPSAGGRRPVRAVVPAGLEDTRSDSERRRDRRYYQEGQYE